MKYLVILLFCTLVSSTAICQDEDAKIFDVEMRDSMLYGGFLFPKFDGESLTFIPIQITGIPAHSLSDSLQRFTSQLDTAHYRQQHERLSIIAQNYQILSRYSERLYNQIEKSQKQIETGKMKNRKIKSGLVIPESAELCPELKCKGNEISQAVLLDGDVICSCVVKPVKTKTTTKK